jgi:hypothetical protein
MFAARPDVASARYRHLTLEFFHTGRQPLVHHRRLLRPRGQLAEHTVRLSQQHRQFRSRQR